MKSRRFDDRLSFLPRFLPPFDIVCFGRTPALPWPRGLRITGRSEVLHATPPSYTGREECGDSRLYHSWQSSKPSVASKKRVSQSKTDNWRPSWQKTHHLLHHLLTTKSGGKMPSAKIQGWCSTSFVLVLLRGADGAVWMHDSAGLVVSLYLSP